MLINRKGKGKIYLIILYISICAAIVYRNYVEATTYTTPDSHFYLRVANNILSGKGFVGPISYPFDEMTIEDILVFGQ